ncbi:uncharacterized protein EI97DRAFT_457813 [Westerdykella ornata]|uniref:Uncharacterized protein n=1 Tax=Westerdykella ornata TaxID=318751 RepID=A0A6A6JKG6_WESOR|nr:uncharacterized protein EI97DRAFT_457813 [Westerdykella ornata]KAF2277091.1 hypothetical protein EI97DRAFT_457813 [Westerdykella ornata]
MMFTSYFALFLTSILASAAIARPQVRVQGEGHGGESHPMPLKSRVTAFINTDNGIQVECWEIGDILPDSRGVPHGLRMAASLESFDIMMWPSHGTIYSPDRGSEAGSIGEKPTLNKIEHGMVRSRIPGHPSTVHGSQESEEHWHFGPNNGDDWFYFDDMSSSRGRGRAGTPAACTNPRALPATTTAEGPRLEAMSNTMTSLISLVYSDTPPHRKMHDGSCALTGLKPVEGRHGKDEDESNSVRQY